MTNLNFDDAISNLSSEDVKVRKEAIESLVGITDESAIEPLIKATTDDNAQVRFKAAEILGNMGELAVDKLIDEFTNAQGKNKRFLAFALKETENDKVVPYFVESTDDEDFGVRKVAVRALGELQAVDNLDSIEKCLSDEDWGVRLAAIQALGDLATDEAIKLIKDARKSEEDKDFKKAVELAPAEMATWYKEQATYIEKVRTTWIDMAKNETPYDIFISYKDSDEAKDIERTKDSINALELYNHLARQGYNVFYSRESLRDKICEKYEPYIFNALKTAKIMILYGTSVEYINSTWVKTHRKQQVKNYLFSLHVQSVSKIYAIRFSPM